MSSVTPDDRVLDLLMRREEILESHGRLASAEELCDEAGCPEWVVPVREAIELLRFTADRTAEPTFDETIRVVATYQPEGYLDQGGMGTIYRARDEDWRREVAVKIVRDDRLNSGDLRRRFLEEARITALLEHPGVVPIYGQSRAEDGRPLSVMRLVRGMTLLEVILKLHQADGPGLGPDERTLSLPKLLPRFVSICETVAFAHSRSVVHRDLTPRNVMLGAYGETLVMDWGLAKCVGDGAAPHVGDIHPSSGSSDAGPTTRGIFGTPGYRSPEHISGRSGAVGPLSDIYSLGAMLLHLITGNAPEDGPPAEGSTSAPKALLAVCRKAMEADSRWRYACALDLAADVQNWLADEPVSAWREPMTVRAWRWMRRHRTLVVAGVASVSIAAIVLGGATILLQSAYRREQGLTNRLTEERDAVRRMLRLAGKQSSLLYANLGDMTRRDRKSSDVHYLSRLREGLLSARTEFETTMQERGELDPLQQSEYARALYQLATITAELHSGPEAVPFYRDAERALRVVVDRAPGETEARSDLARTLDNLGLALLEGDDPSQAREYLREGLDLRQALSDSNPDDFDRKFALAQSLNNTGYGENYGDQPGNAKAFLLRALAVFQELDNEDCPDIEAVCLEIAGVYSNLIDVDRREREFARASEDADTALKLLSRLEKSRSGVANEENYRDTYARTLNNLGQMLGSRGDWEGARDNLAKAVLVLERLVRDEKVKRHRLSLARCFRNLGLAEAAAKNAEPAALAFNNGLKTLEEMGGTLARSFEVGSEAAACRAGLSMILARQGAYREADKTMGLAIESLADLCARFPEQVILRDQLAVAFSNRARFREHLGQFQEALQDWDRAIDSHRAERDRWRLNRTVCLAGTPDYESALTEVREGLKSIPVPLDPMDRDYQVARLLSLASASALEDTSLDDRERTARSASHADAAIRLLGRLERAHYFESPVTLSELRGSRHFSPISSRQEFRELLRRLGDPG